MSEPPLEPLKATWQGIVAAVVPVDMDQTTEWFLDDLDSILTHLIPSIHI